MVKMESVNTCFVYGVRANFFPILDNNLLRKRKNRFAIMRILEYENNSYRSQIQSCSFFGNMLPSIKFYSQFIMIVVRAGLKAKKGPYKSADWVSSSIDVLRGLEGIGVSVEVTGIENIVEQDGPVVFIGNHMSMMETLLLPGIVRPLTEVTFVVKESLLEYPVFKHIMRSRNPIAVSRTNPRQDLKVVMTEGVARLNDRISVIVFPQTTRAQKFDAKQMSSIGVKLAKKAKVPVIPLALKTDGWQNGTLFKDFGKIDTAMTAHFSFGKPLEIVGRGNDEQQLVNEFIAGKLNSWQE